MKVTIPGVTIAVILVVLTVFVIYNEYVDARTIGTQPCINTLRGREKEAQLRKLVCMPSEWLPVWRPCYLVTVIATVFIWLLATLHDEISDRQYHFGVIEFLIIFMIIFLFCFIISTFRNYHLIREICNAAGNSNLP